MTPYPFENVYYCKSGSRPSKEPECIKSMGSDEVHTQVLRELADKAGKPLTISFEKLGQSGEVRDD